MSVLIKQGSGAIYNLSLTLEGIFTSVSVKQEEGVEHTCNFSLKPDKNVQVSMLSRSGWEAQM